jgi:hypothetical protein
MPQKIVCSECHAALVVTEFSGGTPGGQDREQGYCPNCSALVVERVTSGLISVRLDEAGTAPER